MAGALVVVASLATPSSSQVKSEDDAEISLYATLLRNARDVSQGKRVHADILESRYHDNRYLRNLLVEMYGNCGSLRDARMVFDGIQEPNLFSWNIMIKAYVHNGCGREALGFYQRMNSEGVEPNVYTYASILGACSTLEEGQKIHARIIANGLESNVVLGTALLNMYARCGSLIDARSTFERMPEPNVVSWTSMVTAYAQNGHLHDAKSLFDEMPEPNVVSWNTMINAFSRNGRLEEAKSMFDQMPQPDVVSETSMVVAYAQNGHLQEARCMFEKMGQRNVVSWNALIAAYVQSGQLREARGLFEKMPQRDAVSWTCMISGYAQNGHMQEARNLFNKLEQRDVVSWNAMLAGYAQNGELEEARSIFDQMPQQDAVSWNTMLAAYAVNGHLDEARSLFDDMPQPDVVSWNTMISYHAYDGLLEEAKIMFDKMPHKNVVSWNAMIVAYAENGYPKEAIKLVRQMDLEGVQTDKVTFISIFDACAGVAAAEEGKLIHMSIIEAGLESDFGLGDSLVNMYAKCGNLEDARSMFNKMPRAEVESWNAMIAAYSQCGLGMEAVYLFQTFDLEGMQPNDISFVRILSACSHAGLLEDALNYFVSIDEGYDTQVTIDHYLCMVDLLGRAGQLDEAEELIECMPFEPDTVAWMTLLSACKIHGDVGRAMESAKRVFELEPDTSAPYILLSNIYRQLGKSLHQEDFPALAF